MKNQDTRDTIVAQATPLGRSAIGILRVSGSSSHKILGEIWRPLAGQKDAGELSEMRQMTRGEILDGKSGRVLDQVLVCRFAASSSYTGEDMVEIYCHGNPLLLREVMENILLEGARLAEPGEFTKRAFLNGKIDLIQAEAVAQMIEARSKKAFETLQKQMRGEFSEEIQVLRQELLEMVAWIEADIDFGDREVDDVVPVDELNITERLQRLENKTKLLYEQAKRGRFFQEGVEIVIAGRPNVGKSSLFNRLCGQDRALVDSQPGTTRDYLEAWLDFEGIPARVIDTAGLDAKAKGLEARGIERSQACLKKADLVLAVFDQSQELFPEDQEVIRALENLRIPVLSILNKVDLPSRMKGNSPAPFLESIHFSAVTGLGLDNLVNGIARQIHGLLGDDMGSTEENLCLTLRQSEILREASQALQRSVEALAGGMTLECLSVDLRATLNGFSRLLGKEMAAHNLTEETEDILDQVFSTFCIGK